MRLPDVEKLELNQKKILLRLDLDVPLKNGEVVDVTRIDQSLPTIKYLLQKKAKVIILAHLGRPGGKKIEELSLEPVVKIIANNSSIAKTRFGDFDGWEIGENLLMLENLRFYPGEESNDPGFTQKLASLGDLFINEAFANSHREHASIVGLPQNLSSAFGPKFVKEVEILKKIHSKPARPVVLLLGGAKEDKTQKLNQLAKWADQILIGGALPKKFAGFRLLPNIVMGKLTANEKDIEPFSISIFKTYIARAKTIVWAGPMGVFEEPENERGTRQIAQAIVLSGAFSVIGGGETEAAISRFGFDGKMSYVCSGGGAMLEFLAEGTLPGIEVIIKNS